MSHPGAGIVTTVSSPLRELEAVSRVSARDRLLIAMRRGGGAGMVETPDKVAALMDATRALGAMGAPHALIGGVAVGVHSGVPRATADTDLALLSTLDRSAVIQALVAAGLGPTGEFSHKERAAADPARRRSKALRDRADVELLRGDVPDPDEGW